jgi:shikimate kinase
MTETGAPDRLRAIIIVGPKHSGKTSAGKALARLWEGLLGGVRFIDLDELVEARTGKSPRLLYRAGPELFREAEAEALRVLFEGDWGEDHAAEDHAAGDRAAGDRAAGLTVVAAGGGLADNREALELLRAKQAAKRAVAVYLEVPVETAWERISAAAEATGELPPFLDTANPRETHRLLHERRGRVYRELAAFTVGARDTPEETAAAMSRQLGADGLVPAVRFR